MRIAAALFLLSLLAPIGAGAQMAVGKPELTVSLKPDFPEGAGPRPHRQIVMTIRLISPSPFEKLEIALPETIPGAELLPLFRPRTTPFKSYAGDGYAYEAGFALFPLRSGPLVLPEIRAVGKTRAGETFDLTGGGRVLGVRAAPAAAETGEWTVADRVEMTESWSPSPEDARQGDTLRREVVVRAVGATAERMLSPEHAGARGVRIVDAGEERRTEIGPEGAAGVVTRRWDIVIGQQWVANISPVRFEYWNAGRDAPEALSIPALRVEPAPPDRGELIAAAMAEAEAERQAGRRLFIALAALAAAPLVALALVSCWIALPSASDLRLRRRLADEPPPEEALAAVRAWLAEGRKPVALRRAPAVSNALARLETAIHARAPGRTPAGLYADLTKAARATLRGRLAAALRRAALSIAGPAIELAGKGR